MRIFDFLYHSQAAKYVSEYPLPESIGRLKELVHTGFIPGMGVNGKISEHRVRLYWIIPFVANSFAPIFVGKFETSDGKVILSGSYSMHFAVKAFMTLWLAVTLAVSLIATGILGMSYITSRECSAFFLIPCGLFLFGLVMVQAGRWFSRNHIEYIEEVIRKSLGHT
jgi:hypothetical protein